MVSVDTGLVLFWSASLRYRHVFWFVFDFFFLKNFTQACRLFTSNVSYHGIFCICLRLTGSRHGILCLVSCSIILVTMGP